VVIWMAFSASLDVKISETKFKSNQPWVIDIVDRRNSCRFEGSTGRTVITRRWDHLSCRIVNLLNNYAGWPTTMWKMHEAELPLLRAITTKWMRGHFSFTGARIAYFCHQCPLASRPGHSVSWFRPSLKKNVQAEGSLSWPCIFSGGNLE
jgi:hypothetical protein